MSRHAAPSILALDIATTTGWALYASGRTVSGSMCFKPSRWEGGGMRYLRFRREFLSQFRGVREVWFEEVRRHEGVDAAHVYGGLLATLAAWCEENAIPYRGVPVGVIKKHITGKGNASKAAVIEAVRAKGFQPVDDNEADALALLSYVRQRKVAGDMEALHVPA